MSNAAQSENLYQITPQDQKVFLINKQGHFGQGLHGCSFDESAIRQMATDTANRDIDAYHSYDVYVLPLDRNIPMGDDPMRDYGWMNLQPIFSTRKAKDAPPVSYPEPTHSDPLLDNPYRLDADTPSIYVVYKQGMYGHGAHGVSMTANGARQLAMQAAEQDIDDYHCYDVYQLPLDQLTPLSATPMRDYGWMNVDPLYSIKKGA